MNKTTLTFAALALSATAAHAGPGMKPGLWEITVTMDMPGMVMPPMKQQTCMTEQDVASGESTIPKDDQGCKVGGYALNGNTATWSMTCPDMSGKGSMTYSGDSYSGSTEFQMQADGESMQMKQTYSGKRLGDCQK